jgi:hypothetical protein
MGRYHGTVTLCSPRDGRLQLDGRRGFSLLVAKEFWRDGPESRAFKVSRRAVS